RGQVGETGVGGTGASVHGSGGARLARGWGAWGGWGGWGGRLAGEAAGQSGFERGGAKQAAGDAREDLPDVDGAEVPRDVGEVRGGGALLQRGGELPAVVDQRADEAEEAAGAGGLGKGWYDGCGGHDLNESIGLKSASRNIFRTHSLPTPCAVSRGWLRDT
ncbi:MAG TPA: hypothetical protein VNW90_10110, partial [Acetobacteraceae bacterium]|nr:hypothetical protein [Acetobacteraceae bacterium]